MKKCNYCSNLMKDNDSFCSACGKSADAVVAQSKNKSPIAIVLIICITLIIVTAIIVERKPEPYTTGAYATVSQITYQTTTETTTEKTTSATSTTNSVPTTVVVVIEESSTKKATSRYNPPATTKAQRTYYRGSYYYPVNTPSKAGLVLRSRASSSSVKLGVISEYEIVSIVDGYIDGGYIYVYAVDRNAYGWVLADYLAYYGNYYQPATKPAPQTTTTK